VTEKYQPSEPLLPVTTPVLKYVGKAFFQTHTKRVAPAMEFHHEHIGDVGIGGGNDMELACHSLPRGGSGRPSLRRITVC
jgi:hypothetical protein